MSKTPQDYGCTNWYDAITKSSSGINPRRTKAILNSIPKEELTDELIKRIADDYIVRYFTGRDIVMFALGKFVHESAKTQDNLLRWAPQDHRIVSIFPKEMFTDDVLVKLAETCDSRFFGCLPASVRKTAVWQELVKKNLGTFCYLPKKLQTVDLAEETILYYLDQFEAGAAKAYLEAEAIMKVIGKIHGDRKPLSVNCWKRLIRQSPSFLKVLRARPADAVYLQKDSLGRYRSEAWVILDAFMENAGRYKEEYMMEKLPLSLFRDMYEEFKNNQERSLSDGK